MFVVGLTGGIGSGKTAVSDIFKSIGITVVDADVCARTVVEPGKPALEKIQEHFGNQILCRDGTLDRAALRSIVFSNPEEKKWLENLLHPLIFEQMLEELNSATSDYAVLVSPLLIEAGQHLICNRILVVDAPETIQITRTMARDKNSADQVKAIMATQASRKSRLEKANDILLNDSDLVSLRNKVMELHDQYLVMAKKPG